MAAPEKCGGAARKAMSGKQRYLTGQAKTNTLDARFAEEKQNINIDRSIGKTVLILKVEG